MLWTAHRIRLPIPAEQLLSQPVFISSNTPGSFVLCYIPCSLSSSYNILNGAEDCSSQRLPKKTSRRTGYPTRKDIDYLQLKRWSLMVSKHCLPYKIKPTVSNGNLKSLCMVSTHFPAASFGLLWGWSMGLWCHLTDVTKWLFTGSVCPVSILQSKKKNKQLSV